MVDQLHSKMDAVRKKWLLIQDVGNGPEEVSGEGQEDGNTICCAIFVNS